MDFRTDPTFVAGVAAAQAAIESLALAAIPDAEALVSRQAGENNLQGHFKALVPLAVLVLRDAPHLLAHIRGRTQVSNNMTARSPETRDQDLWTPVQQAAVQTVTTHSNDILVDRVGPGTASVSDAARYLSNAYGGTQTAGGAGDTVLKRTLKLLSHAFIA